MRLKLRLEDLSVVSFETLSLDASAGTVFAFDSDLSLYCPTIGGLWTERCARSGCCDAGEGDGQVEAEGDGQVEAEGERQAEAEGEQQQDEQDSPGPGEG